MDSENQDRRGDFQFSSQKTSSCVPPPPPFPGDRVGGSQNFGGSSGTGGNGPRSDWGNGGCGGPGTPPPGFGPGPFASSPFFYGAPPKPSGFWEFARKALIFLFGLAMIGGFLLVLIFFLGFIGLCMSVASSENSENMVTEKVLSGSELAPHKIVILPIEGTITENEEGFIRSAIRAAYEDDRLAGVILRVNSPGGTIAGSDYYYHLLRDLKEERGVPIFVSMGGMAASGGYYVSMTGDKIFAERSTLTGSIGVIGMLFDASKLCEKIGVSSNFIVSGPNKGMGDFTKTMSAAEREIWQGLINDSYEQFLSVIREGRPCFAEEESNGDGASELAVDADSGVISDAETEESGEDDASAEMTEEDSPKKSLREIADGRIYSASEAKKLGLVDEIGFLQDAVEGILNELGLSEEDVEVVRYKKAGGLFNMISSETEEASAVAEVRSAIRTVSGPSLYYLPGGFFPVPSD